MSNFDDDYEDDEPEADSGPMRQMRKQIRDLEKQVKASQTAAQEAEQLRRENLILRTPGLNELSDRKIKALFATHDGEFTPDALKATAIDLGWVQPPEPEVPDAEREAHARMEGVATGASSATAHDPVADALSAGSEDEFWAKAQAAGLVAE